jgi:hypothetical protein
MFDPSHNCLKRLKSEILAGIDPVNIFELARSIERESRKLKISPVKRLPDSLLLSISIKVRGKLPRPLGSEPCKLLLNKRSLERVEILTISGGKIPSRLFFSAQ